MTAQGWIGFLGVVVATLFSAVSAQDASDPLPRCPEPTGQFSFSQEVSISDFSLSKDGRHVLLDRSGDAVLVSSVSGKVENQIAGARSDSFRFSPRGGFILRKSPNRVTVFASQQLDAPLHVFDAGPGFNWHRSMALSADDQLLGLVAEKDLEGLRTSSTIEMLRSELQIFDLATGQEVFRLAGGPFVPSSISLSSDHRLLAVRPSRSTEVVQVWDLSRGERTVRLDSECFGDVRFLYGQDALVIQGPEIRRLWDAVTGKEVAQEGFHLPLRAGFSFSPSSHVAASWPKLVLWDSESHSPLCRGSDEARGPVRFSGDGSNWAVLRSPTMLTLHPIPGRTSPSGTRFHSGEVRLPPVQLESRQPSPPSASADSEPQKRGSIVQLRSGDQCKVVLINFNAEETEFDSINSTTTLEQINQQSLQSGFGGQVGKFETRLGEGNSTQMSFPLPGLDSTVTAAVFYEDSMISPMTMNAMSLALAVDSDGPVEDAFQARNAATAEVTYTFWTGKVRLTREIGSGFLILLECDTTVKYF